MAFVDGGDTFQQATRLGPLRFASSLSQSGAIGALDAGESVDWYQIKAKGRASKSVTLSSIALPTLNQTIEVFFRGAGAKGRGKRVAFATGGAADQRNIKALPGTYFLKISQSAGTIASGGVYSVNLTSLNINSAAS
jgi:hypothetical protein